MGVIKKLNKWANAHSYYPIDLLRIALGVFLTYKGIYFFRNTSFLEKILIDLQFDGFSAVMWSVHLIGMLHFVGGIIIVFGLLTRLSLIIQLPIIVGAVAVNFIGVMNNQNLIEAFIVLMASIFFIFYGSGKHSVDYDLKMET